MRRFYRSFLTFLVGSFIFVILPLISWEPDDIEGFLANSARLSYIIAALLLNGYAAFKIPEFGKKKNAVKKKVDRQHLAVTFLQITSLLLIIAAPFSDRRNFLEISLPDTIRFAVLILYIIGFLIMHLVEAYMGKQFTVEVSIQEDHKLFTEVPFHYIRHPRYSGMIIFTLGLSLIFKSWIALILFFLIILILLWRINDEEKQMHQEFGERWEEYSKKTWRLIPFIY